jgi:5-methylcytosine-specific restriction protein A
VDADFAGFSISIWLFNFDQSMVKRSDPLSIEKEEIMPTAWDFQNRLTAILNDARRSGKAYVDVKSGNLHKQVGEHPNPNHTLPVCCDVMKKLMRAGDLILNEPPSGQGSTLMIRYVLKADGRPQV